jgi:nucleoside-diphosphate-sugar epimerase
LTLKRILVTGASGFIGYHCLAPLVARGYEVHALQSRAAAVAHPNVTWHSADLFDVASTEKLVADVKPSHLLHMAWYVVPGKVINHLDNAVWVQRSIDLLRAFHHNGGTRVTFGGTCYEYDWRYGYCSEQLTPTTPDTYYGICKAALDQMASVYCKLAQISYASARMFFLYGPREHPDRLVSSVVRKLLAGTPAPCSHGEQIRDYMSVEDVGDAVGCLVDSELVGACNIGCGQPLAIKTIVTRVGELIGRPELVQLGAIPARANDVPVVLADTRLLTQTLGWKPQYDLDTGLTRTVDWWREHIRQTGSAA